MKNPTLEWLVLVATTMVVACGGPQKPPGTDAVTAGISVEGFCGNRNCGTRGSVVVPMRSTNAPIFYDDYLGWLGAKITRNAADPLRSADCAGTIAADDVLPKGGTTRTGTISLSSTEAQSFALTLSGGIEGKLSAAISGNASLKAGIEDAVSKTLTGAYEYSVMTYTMDDLKFRNRIQACKGQHGLDNVIFSFTALQLTGNGVAQLKQNLSAGLHLVAGLNAVVGGAEAGVGASIDSAVEETVKQKTAEQPFILFLGFHPEAG